MARILYILGACSLAGMCGVFGCWMKGWNYADPRLLSILSDRNVVDQGHGNDEGRKSGVTGKSVPALVAQAQAFAAILSPPVSPPAAKPATTPVAASDSLPLLTPKTRAAMSSITFKLVATSYYAGRPDKSMALLAEPGNKDGGRWVKEGAQIGHFTVHEIKQGVVVLREGDGVRELAVERTAIEHSLVREVRPATRQFSAAVHDGNEIASAPKVSAEDGPEFTVEGD
jgi:hypothetical protein